VIGPCRRGRSVDVTQNSAAPENEIASARSATKDSREGRRDRTDDEKGRQQKIGDGEGSRSRLLTEQERRQRGATCSTSSFGTK
jgi:hypothetical protein